VLGGEIGDEGVELLLVDRFDVVFGDLRVRCLDFLVLEVLEVFFEVGDVAGRGQEHKDVLVDVLEAAVDVVGELADELRPHVVLHPEESQELPQVIDVVERPLLLQLLGHVLLACHGPRLVRTKRLGYPESVLELSGFIAVLDSEVLLNFDRLLLEVLQQFFERGALVLVVGEGGKSDFFPGGV